MNNAIMETLSLLINPRFYFMLKPPGLCQVDHLPGLFFFCFVFFSKEQQMKRKLFVLQQTANALNCVSAAAAAAAEAPGLTSRLGSAPTRAASRAGSRCARSSESRCLFARARVFKRERP